MKTAPWLVNSATIGVALDDEPLMVKVLSTWDGKPAAIDKTVQVKERGPQEPDWLIVKRIAHADSLTYTSSSSAVYGYIWFSKLVTSDGKNEVEPSKNLDKSTFKFMFSARA